MNTPRKYAVASLVASLLITASASAAADVETVVPFEHLELETPESLAFDKQGNMYVSLALTGEIRKISPDGEHSTLAFLPIESGLTPCNNAFGMGIMGALTLDKHKNVYVSVVSCDSDYTGVWKVTQDGEMDQIANLPTSAMPNGIAYYKDDLYVADAGDGYVWRIDADGCKPPQIWSDDPLLEPLPDFFPGPNGLQIFEDEVYVAVSDRQLIVAIPFGKKGQAKPARVHATGVGLDDFAFDVKGNIYGTTDPYNTVVRVSPKGKVDVLLTHLDGLDGPTAAAFGVKHDKATLFITNAAFPFFVGPDPLARKPSVMSLEIGIKGYNR